MLREKVGVVVIGRNEGERLVESLRSVQEQADAIVYVDSGSTDGSRERASGLGIQVVELDNSLPFCAGRGRNAGFKRLTAQFPHLEFIQFIDGDCILADQWLEKALAKMESDDKVGAVCGRRSEAFPEASLYNLLCDMEWDTSVGETQASGGDVMVRVSSFMQVDGFDINFAAGEEPEMCLRMRQKGWTVWRIDADMTQHDAAMYEFGQWWKRTKRSGRAYAQNAWVHGREPERFNVKESLSIWLYAFVVPVLALSLAWFTNGWSLLLFAAYPWLLWRVYGHRRSHGDGHRRALTYSAFVALGKFPQLLGQMSFLRTRKAKLIEYKGVSGSVTAKKPAHHA